MQVVFKNIGAPEKKASLNTGNGLNSDIINAVNSSFKEAVKQTAAIAQNFKGKTPLETCSNIWHFLRNKINYVKDPQGYQLIRQPRAFLAAKKGDCKSFSLFAAGVLKNIYPDAEIYLRFAGYSSLNIPTHVYTILAINGKKIVVDGVYKYCTKEKKYTFKKDYKMKVYTLSGIEEVETINGRKQRQEKRQEKKEKRQEKKSAQAEAKKTAPKKLKDRIKGVIKKTVKGGKKIGFAPSRGSFLALVALNVKGLGTKVLTAIKEKPEDVKNIWSKVGGDFNQLVKTATTGASKKRIFGIEGIGSASGTAAALTSAAPIIVFFLDLFKKLKTGGVNDTDTKDLETITTDSLNAEGLTPTEAREAANTPEASDNLTPGGNKTALYLGLAAAAALLLGGKNLFKGK